MTDDKKKRLVIIGAGGHGTVAADCARLMNKWSKISFLDSRWPEYKRIYDWEVIGHDEDYPNKTNNSDDLFIAIGNVDIRMKFFHKINEHGYHLATIIHPSAVISKDVVILSGTLIAAGAIINIGSSIASCCIINTSSIVDHDCIIGEGAHICPGVNLGGNVSVGSKTWVGIGATAINGISIGSNSLIGAGAVVVSDIPDNIIALGVPAKVLSKESQKC